MQSLNKVFVGLAILLVTLAARADVVVVAFTAPADAMPGDTYTALVNDAPAGQVDYIDGQTEYQIPGVTIAGGDLVAVKAERCMAAPSTYCIEGTSVPLAIPVAPAAPVLRIERPAP